MKKKLFYFFNILLFLTVTSCSDIFSPQESSISFSIGESVAREITNAVSVSSQITDDTEFTIKVTFDGLTIEPQKIIVTKNKLPTAKLLFEGLPFDKQFKILIDVSFNDIIIYKGESNLITLSEDKDSLGIGIVIKERNGQISYEPNGGTIKDSPEGKVFIQEYFITDNITVDKLPVPKKEWFVFQGWYYDESCEKPVVSLGKDNYIGDVKLFAKWIEIVKPVTFSVDGAVEYKDKVYLKTVTSGAAIYYTTNGDVPTSSSTLYSDSNPISIETAQTIKAIAVCEGMVDSSIKEASYTINTYNVTFKNGGYGNAPAGKSSLKRGDSITLPAKLTADKMDFLGWRLKEKLYNAGAQLTIDPSMAVNKEIIITANWQGVVEPVTFSAMGAVDFGDTISLSSATNGATIYYTIDGSDPSVSSLNYTTTGPITVNDEFISGGKVIKAIAVKNGMRNSDISPANYTINTYTVTFDSNNHGTAPGQNDGLKKYDLVQKPTDLSVRGYKFGEWYKEKACENIWNFDTDKLMGNMKLYAKWTPITYSVKFDRNGGDAEVAAMNNMSMTFDEAKALTQNTYTKSGFEFIGWNKIQNPSNTKDNISDQASKVFNFKDVQDAEQILYAQWNDIAPGGVTNFTASLNSTRDKVHLSWTNPADKDIASVIINSTEAGLANTSVNVKNKAGQVSTYDVSLSTCLDKGTYNFNVKVKDEGGNECTSDKIKTCNIKLPKINAFSVPNARFNKNITVVVTGTNFKSTALNANDFKITAAGKNVTPSSATINSDTELQFTIPGSASTISDTIKVSCVGASSKEGAFEIKQDYALNDIVMTDDTILTKAKCENYRGKAKPVALIFSVKSGSTPAKGVGLFVEMHAWAKLNTTGYNMKFKDIIEYTNSYDLASADMDGSDNWGFVSSADGTGAGNAKTNYPAFNYANNYGSVNFSDTSYAADWYLPSFGELLVMGDDDLNDIVNTIKNKFKENGKNYIRSIRSSNGEAASNLWSSNQAETNQSARTLYLGHNNYTESKDKSLDGVNGEGMFACAVRKFY